jgi:hypothetical protein
LGGNEIKITFCLFERSGIQGKMIFSASANRVNQARSLEHVQVLGDRLPGEPGSRGEAGDRKRLTTG